MEPPWHRPEIHATMLYGHIESAEDRVDHLLSLRHLQDRTGGFQAFIPLSFHSQNTEIKKASYTTGFDDLRTLAVSRRCWTISTISRPIGSCSEKRPLRSR